ncbi:acyl-CoA dehydrogenase [Bradyrhizobium sp. KBS0727]|uniref:acyl-CoA dehydrogenase family protein n=1 Tax=unclassified Bradyrhizobium TaxID=2631580 RepID=UPI00110EC5B0|nr:MULTISPECIES: acyl-CoA dehydrogenase family protein [unclassified Bradyrhizobium]QDW39830.1 acyl-CoA dehydrogenase [Bradyrhizobium sp. KBS0725]QDW46433.1 acyl-CoA dehydrogenase [Bradyrhizobium sp. KBS0727]
MDLQLDDMQTMLRQTARRFVAENHDFDKRTRSIVSEAPSETIWRSFAEMGWLALNIPEKAGGLGCGPVETALIMEELGRGLVTEPYLATAVVAANILAATDVPFAAERLREMVAGDLRIGIALSESATRFDCLEPTTTASRNGNEWRVSGSKRLVLGGESSAYIVCARNGGELGLFWIDGTQGLATRKYRTFDDHRCADIDLCNTPAQLIAAGGRAVAILDEMLNHATMAVCAEALGCLTGALATTIEYVKVRSQFGKTLAEFQVTQHRLANLFVQADQARSMLLYGLSTLSSADAGFGTAGAKFKILDAARFVCGECVHQHGGMGVTTEYPVGHYLRRVLMLEKMFGDSSTQLRRVMERWASADVSGG